MNAREVNALLTEISTVDGRLRKQSSEEQATLAVLWSEILDPDLTLDAARAAVRAHYAVETRAIMPADLNAAVPVWRGPSDAGDVTAQRLAAKARAAVTS